MTLDIRATPFFKDKKLDQLTLHLNTPESIKAFEYLLDRVLNTWEDAPPEWNEISDKIKHGRVLQDYHKFRGPAR